MNKDDEYDDSICSEDEEYPIIFMGDDNNDPDWSKQLARQRMISND